MNAIVQALVNTSTLEVSFISITNATKDSFVISLETRVTNTGPVGATISAMTVDMCGVGGVFGRLDLPVMKTAPGGVTVSVKDQTVKITDMKAFIAFNKSIMSDKEVVLKLENGAPTVKAMFMSTKITFSKTVKFPGMEGPKSIMLKTESDGTTFTNTIRTINPSPLEIDLGTLRAAIRNEKGETVAEQTGKVYLKQGETEYVMKGSVKSGLADAEMRTVGLGIEEDHWGNLTIVNMDGPITATNEFRALCKAA